MRLSSRAKRGDLIMIHQKHEIATSLRSSQRHLQQPRLVNNPGYTIILKELRFLFNFFVKKVSIFFSVMRETSDLIEKCGDGSSSSEVHCGWWEGQFLKNYELVSLQALKKHRKAVIQRFCFFPEFSMK